MVFIFSDFYPFQGYNSKEEPPSIRYSNGKVIIFPFIFVDINTLPLLEFPGGFAIV